MQRHGHMQCTGPHMRSAGGAGGGHHMPMHLSAAAAAVAVGAAVAAAPPPPQSHLPPTQNTMAGHPAQHHHNNMNNAAASHHMGTAPPHLREHHSRLAPQQHQSQQQHQSLQQQQQQQQHHHQHHAQSMHSTSQMQKIRQQHQHLNSNNNNNNINNNNNHTHSRDHSQTLQQSQQYNHINATTQQQQQLQQQQQQQQQHMSTKVGPAATPSQRNVQPLAPPTHHHHHLQQQQQQQRLPHQHLLPHAQLQMQLPLQRMPHLKNPSQQHYYANNNNNTNNNNNNNSSQSHVSRAPHQSRLQPSATSLSAVKCSAPPTTIVAPVSPEAAPSIVELVAMPSSGDAADAPGDSTQSSKVITADEAHDDDCDANKENICADSDLASNEKLRSSSSASRNAKNSNNNYILPNEDSSVAKNSKEKTPMCLVNELARFNKITHQYRLTSEMGPAHCKRFTVTLKLGDEEYAAEGFKIKKAQHLAASDAIEKTKYKHPVPKITRRGDENGGTRANITPTVELNALAMKLGQLVYYLFDPRQMMTNDALIGSPPGGSHGGVPLMVPPPPLPPHARLLDPTYMRRHSGYASMPSTMSMAHTHQRYGVGGSGGGGIGRSYPAKYHNRYGPMVPPPMANGLAVPGGHLTHGTAAYGAPPTPCRITLVVGKQQFAGIGRTMQQAKHDAASRALQVLKVQASNQLNEMLNQSADEADSKSPISLVHEIGIKRSLTVHFKVLREDGPAHMKNFITACIVGTLVTEGEGNGKKVSKKRAAEKMLEELEKLPPLTPTKSPAKRIKVKTAGKTLTSSSAGGSGKAASTSERGGERRKRVAAIKETPDGDAENPITKLIQLQQNRKEKEPVFELIAKNGTEGSRRREFIVEVTAQGMVERGTGSSKKLAKRNAAQNLLVAMGLEDDPKQPTTAEQKTTTEVPASTPAVEKATSSDDAAISSGSSAATAIAIATAVDSFDVPLISTTAGQVPGILILRQNKKHASKRKELAANATLEAAEPKKPDASQLVVMAAAPLPLPVAATVQVAATADTGAGIIAHVPLAPQTSTIDAAPPTAAATATPSTSATLSSSETATSSSSSASAAAAAHMKEQLLYLAKLMGFEVNFSDYPKGNHNEFLTIVTLSTSPPQICHGVGTSSDESRNDAAKNALKILSELGLNNATK